MSPILHQSDADADTSKGLGCRVACGQASSGYVNITLTDGETSPKLEQHKFWWVHRAAAEYLRASSLDAEADAPGGLAWLKSVGPPAPKRTRDCAKSLWDVNQRASANIRGLRKADLQPAQLQGARGNVAN